MKNMNRTKKLATLSLAASMAVASAFVPGLRAHAAAYGKHLKLTVDQAAGTAAIAPATLNWDNATDEAGFMVLQDGVPVGNGAGTFTLSGGGGGAVIAGEDALATGGGNAPVVATFARGHRYTFIGFTTTTATHITTAKWQAFATCTGARVDWATELAASALSTLGDLDLRNTYKHSKLELDRQPNATWGTLTWHLEDVDGAGLAGLSASVDAVPMEGAVTAHGKGTLIYDKSTDSLKGKVAGLRKGAYEYTVTLINHQNVTATFNELEGVADSGSVVLSTGASLSIKDDVVSCAWKFNSKPPQIGAHPVRSRVLNRATGATTDIVTTWDQKELAYVGTGKVYGDVSKGFDCTFTVDTLDWTATASTTAPGAGTVDAKTLTADTGKHLALYRPNPAGDPTGFAWAIEVPKNQTCTVKITIKTGSDTTTVREVTAMASDGIISGLGNTKKGAGKTTVGYTATGAGGKEIARGEVEFDS